jgi:hypothetical protein
MPTALLTHVENGGAPLPGILVGGLLQELVAGARIGIVTAHAVVLIALGARLRIWSSVALYLTASACAITMGCQTLPPGQGYQSLTPNQHPNWCVINKGMVVSGAMLSLEDIRRPKPLMGPGVVPCGLTRGRKDPQPMS